MTVFLASDRLTLVFKSSEWCILCNICIAVQLVARFQLFTGPPHDDKALSLAGKVLYGKLKSGSFYNTKKNKKNKKNKSWTVFKKKWNSENSSVFLGCGFVHILHNWIITEAAGSLIVNSVLLPFQCPGTVEGNNQKEAGRDPRARVSVQVSGCNRHGGKKKKNHSNNSQWSGS